MPESKLSDTTPASLITDGDGSSIAYHRIPGKLPGVVFLSGYFSDMTGDKALRLEEFCRQRGTAFLRFDYTGHGQSSGRFEDGTIGKWAADTTFALDYLTEGPQVLVGSSMGGWIMLLAALQQPERIAGLLGVAAAPDFTDDILSNKLTPEQFEILQKNGVIYEESDDGCDPTPLTWALVEDGKKRRVLHEQIPIDVPVRLIQGMKDLDVPWQTSLRILEKMRSKDVEIQLIKDGDHRLSQDCDLERLTRTLDELLRKISQSQ